MKVGTTTGLRPATFQNLQLNAGVFLCGFGWKEIDSVDGLKAALKAFIAAGTGVLGATRGGGTFECTPEIRNVEADGKRYEFVGSTVNDGWTVQLSTTLIEVTPDNFALALMSAEVEHPEGKSNVTIVKVRTAIDDSDYKPTLCWVGDTSKGFVMIELDNALNTEGANFTFTDKGEGTLPVTFVAHQAELENQDYAPFRIVFFDDPEASGLSSRTNLNADSLALEKPALSDGASDSLALETTTTTTTKTTTSKK